MEELYSNYASALYGLIEKERSEQYLSVLQAFCDLLNENKQLKTALSSYVIGKEEKEKLLEICFKEESLPHLLEWGKVILSHHRMGHIEEIVEAFAMLVHEQHGVKEGVAYTAAPLSKKQLQELEEAFSKKVAAKVVLRNKVDENLLGGIKVALDGKVYDGSLRSRLLELHRKLKKPA